jgi:hypothetical protein
MNDVMVGERVTVILPDRDVDIGIVGENDTIELALRANGTVDLQIGKRTTPSAAQSLRPFPAEGFVSLSGLAQPQVQT